MNRPEPEGPDEPIAELRDLELQPKAGFLDRVRGSVERRRLTADTADLGWVGMQVFVLEMLDMLFGVFRPDRPDKGDSR